MRRKDREVTEKEELIQILENNKVLRLAMIDGDKPYIVPLNFGYDWQEDTLSLYFHSAKAGHKLDVLMKNSSVCFEMDSGHALLEGKIACEYGFAYESIIGFGQAEIVEDNVQKEQGLKLIMKHQAGMPEASFTPQMLNAVAVIKVVSKEFSGKRHVAPEE